MNLLQTTELSVGYAAGGRVRRMVLEGVSVAVAAGELICVLGPNGAGKSTLLRTLAGMQRALGGGVELAGRPLAALRPRELARLVGVVLPERVRVGMLRAAALVALGRHPHTGWLGRLRPEDETAVADALRAVGIERLGSRDVTTLSDGERQKVMIARALAQEPTLLVLDEPTAFLDLPGRVEIMGVLARLAHRGAAPDGRARAVLLSTHDLDLALRSADRIWLLDGRGGMVVGAPEDLVLSGTFQGVFESDAVRYDLDTGSFHIARRPAAAVRLLGAGVAARWTRRALERRGFRVVEGPPGDGEDLPQVEILEEGGRQTWRSTASAATHGSIEELLEGLAGYSAGFQETPHQTDEVRAPGGGDSV